MGFVSTASGPPDLGAPVAPGVGAFFERAAGATALNAEREG